MKHLAWNEIIELAVKQENKWSIYIGNGLDYDKEHDSGVWNYLVETFKALHGGCQGEYFDYMQWFVCGGLMFFETKENAKHIYNLLNVEITDHSAFYVALNSPEGCIDENC